MTPATFVAWFRTTVEGQEEQLPTLGSWLTIMNNLQDVTYPSAGPTDPHGNAYARRADDVKRRLDAGEPVSLAEQRRYVPWHKKTPEGSA